MKLKMARRQENNIIKVSTTLVQVQSIQVKKNIRHIGTIIPTHMHDKLHSIFSKAVFFNPKNGVIIA